MLDGVQGEAPAPWPRGQLDMGQVRARICARLTVAPADFDVARPGPDGRLCHDAFDWYLATIRQGGLSPDERLLWDLAGYPVEAEAGAAPGEMPTMPWATFRSHLWCCLLELHEIVRADPARATAPAPIPLCPLALLLLFRAESGALIATELSLRQRIVLVMIVADSDPRSWSWRGAPAALTVPDVSLDQVRRALQVLERKAFVRSRSQDGGHEIFADFPRLWRLSAAADAREAAVAAGGAP